VNQRFVEAGSLTSAIVSSFGAYATPSEGRTASIFVMTAPDSYRGVYVFRNGFLAALRLFHPAAFDGPPRLIAGIVGHGTSRVEQPTSITRLTPMSFDVDLGEGLIPYLPIPSSEFYDVTDQSASHFIVTFRDTVGKAQILFTSGGSLQTAGFVNGRGLPFGRVDLPAPDSVCEGESVYVAGWALMTTPSGTVTVSRETIAGVDGSESGLIDLGTAEWMPGGRPDIARRFPGFLNGDRAGWNYRLHCARLPAAPAVVHVTAVDGRGVSAELGVRHVSRRSLDAR
jgi:hypothetical protein